MRCRFIAYSIGGFAPLPRDSRLPYLCPLAASIATRNVYYPSSPLRFVPI